MVLYESLFILIVIGLTAIIAGRHLQLAKVAFYLRVLSYQVERLKLLYFDTSNHPPVLECKGAVVASIIDRLHVLGFPSNRLEHW